MILFIMFLLGVLTYLLFASGVLTIEMLQSFKSELLVFVAIYVAINIIIMISKKQKRR